MMILAQRPAALAEVALRVGVVLLVAGIPEALRIALMQTTVGGAQPPVALAIAGSIGFSVVVVAAALCWLATVIIGLRFFQRRRSEHEAQLHAFPQGFDTAQRAPMPEQHAQEQGGVNPQPGSHDVAYRAGHDTVAGIANRAAFDAAFACRWSIRAAMGESLALVILEVDYFRRFNEHYGDEMGDACLREVAETLVVFAKSTGSFVARLDDERFALLPRTTLPGDSAIIAQRALSAIRARTIPHDAGCGGIVTASAGVAVSHPRAGLLPLAMIASAEAALQAAKSAGHDRVVKSQRM